MGALAILHQLKIRELKNCSRHLPIARFLTHVGRLRTAKKIATGESASETYISNRKQSI